MDNLKESRFFYKWRLKLLAVVLAATIWFFVNQSIVIWKTIPNIPVRILNIPQDKAISGLLPNGVYQKRVRLALKGTKQIVNEIEPGDIEIVLDATAAPEEWPVEVTKENLVSLNPDIDLSHHIRDVSQPDLVIHISDLVTADVPLYVVPPKGETPKGYRLVDVYPRVLMQSLTGPQEEIRQVEKSGIAIEFDLSRLSKEELDKIPSKEGEIVFHIPSNWKKIKVPWMSSGLVPINSAEAAHLDIIFLKEEPYPLQNPLPILVKYSFEEASGTNGQTLPLLKGEIVKEQSGLFFLNVPLWMEGVSRPFARLLAPHLSIVIEAQKGKERPLLWNLVVLASRDLEDEYVETLSPYLDPLEWGSIDKEERLRQYFRSYLSSLCLSQEGGKPLDLDIHSERDGIHVHLKQ